MKKTFLSATVSLLLMAGVGLIHSACSSDEVDDRPARLFGEQTIATVNDLPGVVHLDSELNLWYLCPMQKDCVESDVRHYTFTLDNDFQQEGLSVIYSGQLHDLLIRQSDAGSQKSEYYISMDDIKANSHLQPLSDVEEQIAKFLDAATASEDQKNCQINFHGEGEEVYSDAAYVINDRDHLAEIYTGGEEIPEISFDRYTLIVGRAAMPGSATSLAYFDVSSGSDSTVLNLYLHESGIGNAMITNTFFWGLFPKFENEGLVIVRNNSIVAQLHE